MKVDVAIVGGGLVGASLAVALRDMPLSVALVEAAVPPTTAPSWDERCIALNDGSRRIFQSMGVWGALAEQTAAITATHISERGRFGVARFAAHDAGLDALGHNTPLRALGAVLMARAQASSKTTWLSPAKLTALSLRQDDVELQLDHATQKSLQATLVVAADGASSAVRALLGFASETRDYEQTGLVTAVRVLRDPKGVAYERFTPDGPFAMLPKPRLPDDKERGFPCSLIWTLPHARAAQLKALPDAEFMALAQDTFGERLGQFLSLGRRISYPLQRTVTETLTAQRVVFCGNAAQSLHPVAAQGFNLGLRDVATLAASLREAAQSGADVGEAARLSAYAASRADDRQRTANFTDQLVRLFSNHIPLLRSVRHLGLLALDLTPMVKDAVLRQNLGHRGLGGFAA